MYETELEVVNACLATMGQSPLNSLLDDHPYKAAAQLKLQTSNRREQKRGWWFNSEYLKLLPEVDTKYIKIPQDVLAVKPIEKLQPPFGQRGTRLYNNSTNSYEWDWPVWVDCIRLLNFEDLPSAAADAVSTGAVLRFQRDFDSDSQRERSLAADYTMARAELVAEDTRNVRPNLLMTHSNQWKMSQMGNYRNVLPAIPIR